MIVMKVTKTHYNERAMSKYKKLKIDLQKEIRFIVKDKINEHEKNKDLEI